MTQSTLLSSWSYVFVFPTCNQLRDPRTLPAPGFIPQEQQDSLEYSAEGSVAPGGARIEAQIVCYSHSLHLYLRTINKQAGIKGQSQATQRNILQ